MLSKSGQLFLNVARPAFLACQKRYFQPRLGGVPTKFVFVHEDPETTLGPYPRTKEERERAARKYNLIPEDYEPYEESECFGDYPKLKAIGAFNRDPYDDFDDVWDSRFYGEPYHRDADMYHWERVDPLAHEKPLQESFWWKLLIFSSAALFAPMILYGVEYGGLSINHPWKHRDFYAKDHKIYEFPQSASSSHHK